MTSKDDENRRLTDHLANERTFLAWIRTSIALMGLGFVIVKFALFIKHVTMVIGGTYVPTPSQNTSSSVIGIAVVAFGVLLAGLSFWQYKRIEKQILEHTYTSYSPLSVLLTATITLGGLLLLIYLISSIVS